MAKRPIKRKSTKKAATTSALVVIPKPRTNYKGAFDIKPVKQVNWPTLKSEFMLHPSYSKPRTFLQEVHGWSKAKVNTNGYVTRHIDGWGKEKAQFRQKLLDESLEQLRRIEQDRLPDILRAKLNTIASFVNAGLSDNLGKLSFQDRALLLKALKTELGEPTTVGQQNITVQPIPQELPADVAERLAQDAITP